MFRVTVDMHSRGKKVREYKDAAEALKWLMDDGHFTNPDTLEISWISVPECEHRWSVNGADGESLYLRCDPCGKDVHFEHSRLSSLARIVQR